MSRPSPDPDSDADRALPAGRLAAAHLYVAVVLLCGAAVFAHAVLQPDAAAPLRDPAVWVLALGVIVGELFPVRIRRDGPHGEIAPSTTFCFALLIAAGETAIVLVALAAVLSDVIVRKPLVKVAFNGAQYAVSLAAAWLVLSALTDVPRPDPIPFAPGDLGPIVAAGAVYFVCNSTLVGAVLALLERRSLSRTLLGDLRFEASSTALLLGLSPLVVLVGAYSVLLLPLLLLPVLSAVRSQREAIAREHDSLHDDLTGLPNRLLLADRVHAALSANAEHNAPFALLVMDLDRFKEVNDTLGHHEGDRLLREVGRRLRATLRAVDVPARLSGDEFALLLQGCDREGAERVAREVLSALAAPVALGQVEMGIRASLGVALYPQHGATVEDLVQRADAAMYAAKRSGAGVAVFEASSGDDGLTRSALARGLESALELGQLVPHFQPTVDLRTGTVAGVEALMRWEHPERGLLHPGDFMALAEQTGLIVPATLQMLDATLAARNAWKREGVDLRVAVNLSARSLMHRRLPEQVGELLERHGTPPAAVELEITESMIMADPERAQQVLETLSGMGISIAIDDFGTGYSSLDRLRRLPVDAIKIDRSFVMQMHADRSDAVIVRSTIDLGRNLGLRVVAEGVETAAAMDDLRGLGCHVAQGFHISRPVPPETIAPFTAAYNRELPVLGRAGAAPRG